MLKIKGFEFNMFGEMTYVVYDPESKKAAIIDPGMMNTREATELFDFIVKEGLIIEHVIATHLHVDHVMGLSRIIEKYGVGLEANPDDGFLGKRVAEQIQMFRLPIEMGRIEISHELHDGDLIKIGDDDLKVICVPGHSPGSIALYSANGNFVITGDALFAGSVGRTDLPGGDYSTLITAIQNRLLTLPDSTAIYPGHGPASTIGAQKRSNPYI